MLKMAYMNTLQMTKTHSDFDENESSPSELSAQASGNLDKEPHNSDGIEAWDFANEHSLSVLRLTISGVSRSVLLNFDTNTVSQEMVVKYGYPYKRSIRIFLASLSGHFCGG